MAPITRSRAAACKIKLKFPSLPTELRLMIWHETFKPRILHITSETTSLPLPIFMQDSHSLQSSRTAARRTPNMSRVSIPLYTVYIANELSEFFKLAKRTDKKTIRSIRVLAVGIILLDVDLRSYTAKTLRLFGSLDTLIFVAKGEDGEDEEKSIREKAEEVLVEVLKDRQENRKEWKLPAVKMMDLQALENYL